MQWAEVNSRNVVKVSPAEVLNGCGAGPGEGSEDRRPMDSPRPREDMPLLHFVVITTPTALSVQLGGEVDLANVDALHAKLTAIELDGVAAVELDLHLLTFCDSHGANNQARHTGHRSTIRGAAPSTQRLLRLVADGDQPVFA